jgi:mRNA interferase MazF
MRPGEIWLVKLGEAAGREQHGLRPAIILANTPTSIAVIVPLTANLKALRFPYTIQIEPSTKNGLTVVSVALIFHLRAMDKSRLVKKIGGLEKSRLENVSGLIKKMLAL